MTLHRLALSLESPLGTALVGPTLFGLVCLTLRDLEGDAFLEHWLGVPENIWRISDGFPAGLLPKPLVRPRALPPEGLDSIKLRKRRPWIRRETWLKHREAWSEQILSDDDFMLDPACPRKLAHNAVDRHGRGTLESGGLYYLEEDWRFAGGNGNIDLYVKSHESPERIRSLIEAVGQRGYGRDASTGRGRFSVTEVVLDSELADLSGATRGMSLSRGVLTPSTMRDAYWRIEPHFGRVGPELTLLGVSPFKRPVLLTMPGTTFRFDGNETLGRWVRDVHPDRPEIGLNGFHLAIPFSEADQ